MARNEQGITRNSQYEGSDDVTIMERIRRSAVLRFAGTVLAFSPLAACGGEDTPADRPETSQTAEAPGKSVNQLKTLEQHNEEWAKTGITSTNYVESNRMFNLTEEQITEAREQTDAQFLEMFESFNRSKGEQRATDGGTRTYNVSTERFSFDETRNGVLVSFTSEYRSPGEMPLVEKTKHVYGVVHEAGSTADTSIDAVEEGVKSGDSDYEIKAATYSFELYQLGGTEANDRPTGIITGLQFGYEANPATANAMFTTANLYNGSEISTPVNQVISDSKQLINTPPAARFWHVNNDNNSTLGTRGNL